MAGNGASPSAANVAALAHVRIIAETNRGRDTARIHSVLRAGVSRRCHCRTLASPATRLA